MHAALYVVQNAERGDGAGNQPQNGKQILRRGKTERAQSMLPAKFLQIDPFVALDGNQIVIALLVVPDEEVLGVPFRVRQMNGRELLHVEYRRMLDLFIGNLLLAQKRIDGKLVHRGHLRISVYMPIVSRSRTSGNPAKRRALPQKLYVRARRARFCRAGAR